MPDYTPEEIAKLIGLLPPAPAGWIESAQELPAAGRALDELVARAAAHAGQRAEILADLEAALRAAGVEPNRTLMDELRGRLGEEI
jgi:hypothetical protein